MSTTKELASTAEPTNRLAVLRLASTALAEQLEERKLIGEYISKAMIEGEDYGVIPGTEKKDAQGKVIGGKKTLLKPGAEKLCGLFRCVPEFEYEAVVERHFPNGDGPAMYFYRMRVAIRSMDTGEIVAYGLGSASTLESKHRWRNESRKCPACGRATINKSKFPPRNNPDAEPGYYCYEKVGGCGVQYDAADASIVDQVVGKIENPDVADQGNTVLKMAKKRALVDGSLALARVSDMFTQDAEELPEYQQPRSNNLPAGQQNQQQKTNGQATHHEPSKQQQQKTEVPGMTRNQIETLIETCTSTKDKTWNVIKNWVDVSMTAGTINAQDREYLNGVRGKVMDSFKAKEAAQKPQQESKEDERKNKEQLYALIGDEGRKYDSFMREDLAFVKWCHNNFGCSWEAIRAAYEVTELENVLASIRNTNGSEGDIPF